MQPNQDSSLTYPIPHGSSEELETARQQLDLGNYAQAELFLRRHIAAHGNDAQTQALLAKIARGFGLSPSFRLSETHTPPSDQRPRYLLIKAWGFGFWSDVHHVLGQLLLAELTHRIPVVHWGSNSLFSDSDDESNAFAQFFALPSPVSLKALCVEGLRYYPPKWNQGNLHQNNLSKADGAYSKLAAQYLFHRDEDVLVSDYYMPVATLLPWLSPDSRYFGLSDSQIYSDLFESHLRPLPAIANRAEEFFQQNMQGRHWVAVHVRGSDKVFESHGLAQINNSYFGFVDHIIQLNPGIGVFLLTDSVDIHTAFAQRYGDQLLTTPVLRSSNHIGIHYQQQSGLRVGTEVLVDALLAVKCAYFIGNGESNVSLAISSLKRWPKGLIGLMGITDFRGESTMLYAREPTAQTACRLCSGATQLAFRKQVWGSIT